MDRVDATRSNVLLTQTSIYSRIVGSKSYELTDHLGNVRAVVGDITLPSGMNFTADLKSSTEYYPFGMALPTRGYQSAEYRYGYNGQEKDDEIYGAGNLNTAEYWEYDTRVARRWNIDPRPDVSISPYACFANNPIMFSDMKGDTTADYDENGKFLQHTPDGKETWSGRIMNQTKVVSTFQFNDGTYEEDLKLIRSRVDLTIVSQNDIVNTLQASGVWGKEAQDAPLTYIERESRPSGDESVLSGRSSGKMDYFGTSKLIVSSNLSAAFAGKPRALFLVRATIEGSPAIAYNPRDFGNFLWAAGGKALGFDMSTLFTAAWANNLVNLRKDNPNQKWYNWRPWDDPADSRAQHAGYYYPKPPPRYQDRRFDTP